MIAKKFRLQTPLNQRAARSEDLALWRRAFITGDVSSSAAKDSLERAYASFHANAIKQVEDWRETSLVNPNKPGLAGYV